MVFAIFQMRFNKEYLPIGPNVDIITLSEEIICGASFAEGRIVDAISASSGN